MSSIRSSDVYRFVVVYRREPSDSLSESEHWRGQVVCVPETKSQSTQEFTVAFTDLDQLPQIMRQCMANEGVGQQSGNDPEQP